MPNCSIVNYRAKAESLRPRAKPPEDRPGLDARQVLLERIDDAGRRGIQAVLREDTRLDLRGHADLPHGSNYWLAKVGGEPIAGFMPLDGSPEFASVPEARSSSYIAVDDVDARLKKATAAGGKVMREPFDVAGVGRIAILMDSRGVAIGLMTPVN